MAMKVYLTLLCVGGHAHAHATVAAAARPMTSYMYGDERVSIPDPSAVVYGGGGGGSSPSPCADVRNHTRYMGHDVGGDPTPGVNTETLEDCCALCNANARCAHVTWNVGVCYMKTSAVGAAERVRGPQIAASRRSAMPPPPPPTPPYAGRLPNLVFLIVESTDGRTYHEDSDAYIPNIRELQKRGAYFKNFYSNSPVCAASRTSVWSGRHVHRIPHVNQGVKVNGAWNNAEGNAPDFRKGWGDALETLGTQVNYSSNRPASMNRQGDQHTVRQGCTSCSFGKTDWTVGAHALWNWLQCWTMYAPLPYNLTQNMSVHTSAPDRHNAVAGDGGWSEQPLGGDCRSDGMVTSAEKTHQEDWGAAALNTAWVRDKTMSGATHAQPFYIYQGMNIVHPPYHTTKNWYDKIAANLSVPAWQPLDKMHPCGMQSAMLKGCIPTAAEAEDFYSVTLNCASNEVARRRNVRRVYLAMIAEFDAMVGEYVQAVEDAGLTERTIFVVTSDHGDMDMEQQQFYKMVPYEASTRVPLVVAGPGVVKGQTFMQATSLIDLYPTLLELGSASVPAGHDIDGHSLVPLLSGKAGAVDEARPQYAVSQGHMADNAISWFVIRQGDWKLIVYGTGQENRPQLFNITADPMEAHDLGVSPDDQHERLIASLSATLSSAFKGFTKDGVPEGQDFSAVALDVADYNIQMMRWYIGGGWNSTAGGNQPAGHCGREGGCRDWKEAVMEPRGGLPGGASGQAWSSGGGWGRAAAAVAAIETWVSAPPRVLPCRPFDWKPAQA